MISQIIVLGGGAIGSVYAAKLAEPDRPFDERPGLEAYAAPAPEGFGDYRTFCGT